MEDMDLLLRYAEDGSQEAFSELVSRHIDWVHAVCRRRVGDPGTADDVTQAVFIVLARKAKKMPRGTVLAGWLMNTARYAAADAVKAQARRRRHEARAAGMAPRATQRAADSDADADLLTRVDGAMARLPALDRDALALRYHAGKSFEEIGGTLGLGTEAAKKRVSRGVEKLRGMLGGGLPAIPAAAVAGALASTAQAAPEGLTASSVAAATTGPAGAPHAIAQGAAQMMAWAKARLVAAWVAALALLAGGAEAARRSAAAPTPTAAALAPAIPAAAVPVAPSPASPPPGGSFLLDAGDGIPRPMERGLLRFTDTGGRFDHFHIAIAVQALPGRDITPVEMVVERDGASTAMLVRTIRDGLPCAYATDGLLARLDPTTPGGLVIAEGVGPEVVLRATDPAAGAGGRITELRTAAAPRRRIDIDIGSLIEAMNKGATGRSRDEKQGFVRLSNAHAGGHVALVARPAPGMPPVAGFGLTEVVRLAYQVREIRVGPESLSLPRLSPAQFHALGLPTRRDDNGLAGADLFPPAGLIEPRPHSLAAAKLKALIQQHRPNQAPAEKSRP